MTLTFRMNPGQAMHQLVGVEEVLKRRLTLGYHLFQVTTEISRGHGNQVSAVRCLHGIYPPLDIAALL